MASIIDEEFRNGMSVGVLYWKLSEQVHVSLKVLHCYGFMSDLDVIWKTYMFLYLKLLKHGLRFE